MATNEDERDAPPEDAREETADPEAAVEPDAEAGGVRAGEEEAPESADRPKLFRELDPRERRARAALLAFTIYHLSAVLLGGTIATFRRYFDPVVGFYSEGLRMTNTWGMFGRPPTTTNVLIEADRKDGTRLVLATTRASDRTLLERVRDVRVRKIQAKLAEEGDRQRFGQPFLDYYCRQGKITVGEELRAVRAVEIVHEVKNDDGVVTRRESKKTLLTRRCADRLGPIVPPKSNLLPSFRVPPRAGDNATPSGAPNDGDT